MYNRGNDRSESGRREDFEDRDYRHSSNKPRSRWDDGDRDRHRDPNPSRDDDERRTEGPSSGGRPRSRWDSQETNIKRPEGGSSSSTSRWEEDKHYSSSSHSRRDDRKSRSRSRSNSPFRTRSGDDYSAYSNPSRCDNRETVNHSNMGSGIGSSSYVKGGSTWSDSSDDEDYKSKSRPNQSAISITPSKTYKARSSSNDDNRSRPNSSSGGVCLKLNGPGASSKSAMPLPKIISVSAPVKTTKVAAIFNDDDDEPEEMPAECKMRMKNVGRETKTSEGPNSFGKTKIGFCNMSHLTEKKLAGKGPGPAGVKKP